MNYYAVAASYKTQELISMLTLQVYHAHSEEEAMGAMYKEIKKTGGIFITLVVKLLELPDTHS